MNTYIIEYEDSNGRRYTTTVESWSKHDAAEIFKRDNPRTTILTIQEIGDEIR